MVVGAGPGGLTAAARLAGRGRGELGVILIAPARRATFLAGTLDILLDEAVPPACSTAVSLPGVDVLDLEVDSVAPEGVHAGGELLAADAVIAAPGLNLADRARLPSWSRAAWAWDPDAAREARGVLDSGWQGRIVVAACGVPYRCPPAPFALAIRLAERQAQAGVAVAVTIATPERSPLAGVGGGAPALVLDACQAAGVEVASGFSVDMDASGDGHLRAADGRELVYDSALLIPPHERSACLAGLPGEGPLVAVDDHGRVDGATLYVVGDAAATGFPRAAGVARSGAIAAADLVLEQLGVREAPPRAPTKASCFMFHAGGLVSRIRVTYADGGSEVEIDGPNAELASERDAERLRFLEAARGG